MKIRTFILACLAALIMGCDDETEERVEDFTDPGTGSATEFIVDAINDHGGSFDLPEERFDLGSTWRYARDDDGVQVFLYDSDFKAVASFLRDVLGDPDPDSGSYEFDAAMEEGGGWYAVRDKDVAVSYWDVEGEHVHVIVMRAQTY